MKGTGTQSSHFFYLAWSAYPLAALLIAAPLLDLVTTILPFRVGEPTWRYGSAGLLATALLTPILGGLLAGVAAAVLGHRRVQWVLTSVSAFLSIAILSALAMFILDALQVRASVIPEVKFAFDMSTLKVLVIDSLGITVLATLGFTGFRTLRRGRTPKGLVEVPLAVAVKPP